MITTLPEHLKPIVRNSVARRGCECELCESQRDETEETFLRILNACLDGGVAHQGKGNDVDAGWVASSCEDSPLCNDDNFAALILNLGKSK